MGAEIRRTPSTPTVFTHTLQETILIYLSSFADVLDALLMTMFCSSIILLQLPHSHIIKISLQ